MDTIEARTVLLENDLIKVFLTEKGGRPAAVELKKYNRYDTLPVTLFDEDSSSFGLNYYINNQWFHTKNLYFKSLTDTDTLLVKESAATVTFRHNVDSGKYIEFRYSLAPGKYQVDMEIQFFNLDNIDTRRTGVLDLDWMIHSPQQEKGRDNEMQYTNLYFKNYQEDVDYLQARSKKQLQSKDVLTRLEWIAYKDQFFSSVIMADSFFTDALLKSELKSKNSHYMKKFESTIGLPYEKGQQKSIPLHFYFGPNKFKLLKKEYGDQQLQDLVSVGKGIIKWINQIVIIKLFDFLNKFIGNYGIIILIMTIIIKVGLLPLTFKSYMSTAR
jgi:YidC/Oxa1 family membrane protein insertase